MVRPEAVVSPGSTTGVQVTPLSLERRSAACVPPAQTVLPMTATIENCVPGLARAMFQTPSPAKRSTAPEGEILQRVCARDFASRAPLAIAPDSGIAEFCSAEVTGAASD